MTHDETVPIVAVTGTNGKTTVTRLIAHVFAASGRVVGMTTTEGIYVGGARVYEGDCAGPQSARDVLADPRVEVAVLETARGGILREGLAFGACRVGVVTNVSRDHMGIDGVETLDDLANVKRRVVEHVAPDGVAVLNAEDARVAAMATACPGEVVYFASDATSTTVATHVAAGRRAAYVRDGAIVLASGREERRLVDLAELAFTARGRIGFQVQNALAAAAAAWAGGVDPETIAEALRTFASDLGSNPGRFNVTELQGVEVVIDYGHNAAALEALGQALATLEGRRTVALMGPPGDRPDGDLIATVRATLPYVDAYVLHDPNPRGREPTAVPRLLAAQLPPEKPHQFASSREDGIERAWRWVAPGDRLLMFADHPEAMAATLQHVARTSPDSSTEARPLQRHPVAIRGLRFLRGPNLYAYMPVMQADLDVGPYARHGSDAFPGFVDRLTAWLPGLATHECSVGRPGGFIERLHRGTYLPHIVEHVCLELQGVMGFDVTFGRARPVGEDGVYRVVVAYREEEPARAAFETALALTQAAMHDEPFPVEAELERLRDLADEHRFGPSTQAIVDAARRRRIPILRLTPRSGLVQLGWGVHQKRIQASETSNTSAIAVDMCQEKPLTNAMLRRVGVPVPEGRTVRSGDEAWACAREVGLPVVVKPQDGNQGKGVSVNLTTEAEVRAAYEIAAGFRRGVMVEQYIQGDDYRLLVVGGKMVAAARRDPAQVVGDGEQTVAELVEVANRDPRRRPGHASTMTRIRLDEAADLVLAQQGLAREAIPEAGRAVKLRTNANLSTGGTATDVTDEVHPSNVRIAELAAQILALDVAGIDVLCRDIRRPLKEQRGAIVEVNAAPGLRMHLYPAAGKGRDVGVPIVEMLYPRGAPSRIPIIAVTGTNGKTTVTRLIAHIYETARYVVGMTSTEGTYIGRDRILEGDCSGPRSAQAVLLHPHVEVAVLETARGGILREGLAFDECKVGVVTNVSRDHMGLAGIETLDDLVKVKQVVIENVARDGVGVLNADDPRVAEMAAVCSGEVVYFASSGQNPVVAAHRRAGGRCVFVQENRIVLATGPTASELIDLERVPFTAEGRIGFQVENALAAVAAVWAAGLNPAMIARALSTFSTDAVMVPGRFNVVQLRGVQVVFDYGHNPAALAAVGQAVEVLGKRRTVMLLSLPGDRRDEDLRAALDATRSYVDEYVLFDVDRRGRAPGEVSRMLQEHLAGAVPSTIAYAKDEAIREAWARAEAGGRLIVIVDLGDDALQMLQTLTGSLAEDARCEAPIAARTRR